MFSPRSWGSNISEDKKEYTEQEFALILSKASELARSPDVGERPPSGFSLAEMKAIAAEAGLDPVLIERAARLMPVDGGESRLSRVLGGPVKHRRDAHFETRLTEEKTAQLLSAVRAAVEMQGHGDANSSGMSWNSGGEGSQIFVTAHTEGEGTRVRVTVDRARVLIGTAFISLIGGLAVAGMTGVIGVSLGVPEVAVRVGSLVGGVVGSLALGRAVWVSTTRGIRAKVDALMDTVSRSLAESGSESASSEETGGPNREGDDARISRLPDGGAS